jgi:cell division protein FtsL
MPNFRSRSSQPAKEELSFYKTKENTEQTIIASKGETIVLTRLEKTLIISLLVAILSLLILPKDKVNPDVAHHTPPGP